MLVISDSLDVLTAAIFIVIFVLVVFSSLYDRILRNTTSMQADNHYKSSLFLKSHQILTLFSIRRNWCILSKPATSDVRDLRFIQAIRTLTTFGVIIGHCGWFSIILPSINPIFIEDVRITVADNQFLQLKPFFRFTQMFRRCLL
jgi:hypothetical protein